MLYVLFCFARFGPGNSGFNSGFARVNGCFWCHYNVCCSALRALAGNGRFDGRFTRVGCCFRLCVLRFFCLTSTGFCLRASRAAIASLLSGFAPPGSPRAEWPRLFLANARQSGVNRILILLCGLHGCLFMAFLTRRFLALRRA
jgi:hypothetical protein